MHILHAHVGFIVSVVCSLLQNKGPHFEKYKLGILAAHQPWSEFKERVRFIVKWLCGSPVAVRI